MMTTIDESTAKQTSTPTPRPGHDYRVRVLKRFPFTLGMILAILVTAAITNTLGRPITPEDLARWGVGQSDVYTTGRVHAFADWLPVYARGGWVIDLMRRRSDCMAGAMDFVIGQSLMYFKDRSSPGACLHPPPPERRSSRCRRLIGGYRCG